MLGNAREIYGGMRRFHFRCTELEIPFESSKWWFLATGHTGFYNLSGVGGMEWS